MQVRIKPELVEKLKELMKTEDRSAAWVVAMLMEKALAEKSQ